jgi:hypothetical protein
MVFNTTFNNISAHPNGLRLWCLTPLSTIFQPILVGEIWRHERKGLDLINSKEKLHKNWMLNKYSALTFQICEIAEFGVL